VTSLTSSCDWHEAPKSSRLREIPGGAGLYPAIAIYNSPAPTRRRKWLPNFIVSFLLLLFLLVSCVCGLPRWSDNRGRP